MSEGRPMSDSREGPLGSVMGDGLGLAPQALGLALVEFLGQIHAGWNIKDVTTGRYLQLNAPMAALLGLPAEAVVGRVDAELPDAAAWLPMRAAEQYAATQGAAQTLVHHVELRGQVREFKVTRIPLPSIGNPAQHLVGSVWMEQTLERQREQQLQQALRQLEQQAQAPQAEVLAQARSEAEWRATFEDQLRRELDLSNREHREFALVSVAIDPFDADLARHGEAARERVHQAVARLLRSNTRAMDAACQLDPCRFAILLSGVGLATAHTRIEGLRRQCATEIIAIDGQDLRFTVSMGVASYPHTAQDRDSLVAAAGAALGQAQRRGGNHVALASIRFAPG